MPDTSNSQILTERFQRLVQAGTRINAEHSLQKVLALAAQFLREIIDARYAAIGILDETGDHIDDFVTSGVSDDVRASIGNPPEGKGILGTLINNPEPLRIGDLSKHADSKGFPDNHPVMKSFLGVPVMGRKGPIGNLYLTDKIEADEFNEEDESVAILFAAQVSVAVENARLYENTNRLLNEIRELHTSREQFFSTINHEMRNALTAVHGWSDLLLRKMGPTAPQAALEVYESAENTLELIDDLLFLGRIDQGRVHPEAKEFDCGTVLNKIHELLRETAREKGVKLEFDDVASGISCYSDPRQIERMLTNLVAYAVRHCPDNDRVSVTGKRQDDGVRINVRYGGPAIDPEIQKILFAQYVPGDTSRVRGTGLGLPLAQGLARLLGTQIHVESQEDTGTRFWLDLPLTLPNL